MNITLATDSVAVFVWIDFTSDRPGTFSQNGFLFYEDFKIIKYYAKTDISDILQFKNELTLTHLAQIIL